MQQEKLLLYKDLDSNCFDYQILAKTNPYLLKESIDKYFPIVNFCKTMLEKRIELDQNILEHVPIHKQVWYIQNSKSKFIDTLFEELLLQLKARASEIFTFAQKKEFELFDSIKQIYIQ